MIKHIDAITDSTNMMCKEKNGNAIIMKCYAKFQYDVKYEMFSGYVLW